MTQPTQDDIRRAELRKQIADRDRAAYQIALGYALSLFGPGWIPHGHHDLIEADDAIRLRYASERPKPVATVHSCRRGAEERHFVVENGTARAVASIEEGLPMMNDRHPTKLISVLGKQVSPARYELNWGWFENARLPRSAEQLAAAREKREQKAVELEAEGNLFRNQVLAEGPVRKGKSR